MGDLSGVSDAAWMSCSSQRPAALAVPCGSRWVASGLPDADLTSAWPPVVTPCNEHDTIYAISSDFGDRMTTQSLGLMVLLSEHF